MNQHGCRDVRCRPTIPTVHVIVHDRSNRQRINAKVNGLDFSTVGVLYFLMYIALENVSEKKKIPLPLEERFYNKSITVDFWLVYRLFSACQWLVTNKQTNTKSIQVHNLSMFYPLWFWRNHSLHLVFSSKFLHYLSRKQMSLPHEQLYFNDQRFFL